MASFHSTRCITLLFSQITIEKTVTNSFKVRVRKDRGSFKILVKIVRMTMHNATSRDLHGHATLQSSCVVAWFMFFL